MLRHRAHSSAAGIAYEPIWASTATAITRAAANPAYAVQRGSIAVRTVTTAIAVMVSAVLAALRAET
jgi:hypothetical protein